MFKEIKEKEYLIEILTRYSEKINSFFSDPKKLKELKKNNCENYEIVNKFLSYNSLKNLINNKDEKIKKNKI